MGESPSVDDVVTPAAPPGVIVSLVLGSVHMWHLRGHRSNVVDLIVKHFTSYELLEARKELCSAVGATDPIARRDSDHRSAAEAHAVDLLDQVGELDSQRKLPVIVVPSTLLAKVPVSTLLASDDVAVGARLDNLERSIKLLADTVTRGMTAVTSTNSQGLFAGARNRVNSNSGGRGGVQTLQQVPQVSVTPPLGGVAGVTSWAGVAGAEGAASLQAGIGNRDRLGSDAEKRKREEDYKLPGRQRGRKVAIGMSTANVDDGGEAAPLEYYVGNTTPRANPDIIKAVLVKCATVIGKELQVLDVKCLTTGIDHPRTRSWKVKVPYKYKELMEKNELYPEGWTYRKFFAPRNANQGAGNKKPRHDDVLVQQVLQEHQQQADQSPASGPGQDDAQPV